MTSWRKSSYSADTANCVEISWRKSTYSDSSANCVEVAFTQDTVAARDSKNVSGPVLEFPATAWARFLRRFPGSARV
jgi:hypothetical protein